jgi:hypothetical protein
MNSSCGTPGSLRALIGLPVLRQHNTLMAVPGTVDQFGEMTAGLRNRTRERHSSTVQLDPDSRRYGAPTPAAQRLGPFQGTPPGRAGTRHRYLPRRTRQHRTAWCAARDPPQPPAGNR